MRSVFISYSHLEPDSSLARQVATALKAKGHRVFIDTDIPPGSEWSSVIDTELVNGDVLIALISRHSAASDAVAAEVSSAHRLNRQNGRPGIIAVRLGEAFGLPYRLRLALDPFQQIAWTGPAQTERLIDTLGETLLLPSAAARATPARDLLIKRVRNERIRDRLTEPLRGLVRLDVPLRMEPDAVVRTLDLAVQRETRRTPVPAGTPILQIFDEQEEQLLILGAGGSGKTMLLLQLTSDLLDRAERVPGHPVPVVFDLSTWGHTPVPLEEWMATQLQQAYEVPVALASIFIKDCQVLPLLDGLDEVGIGQRVRCLAAINTYRETHGWASVAVCCRSEEYYALGERLRLRGAVTILPLQRAGVQRSLEASAEELGSVVARLQASPELWALLDTPLMVTVLVRASQQGGGIPTDLTIPTLFAWYLEQMFRRRAEEKRYSQRDIRRWLRWLASNMRAHAQSTVFLEQVVPRWCLAGRGDLTVLVIAVTAILSTAWLGLLLGATVVASGDDRYDVGWSVLLGATSIFGLISVVATVPLSLLFGRRAQPVEAVEVRFPGWMAVLRAGLTGAGLGGICAGGVGAALLPLAEGGLPPLQSGIGAGILGAIILGPVLIARAFFSGKMLEQRTDPQSAVRRSMRRAAAWTLLMPLMFGLLLAAAGELRTGVFGLLHLLVVLLGWTGMLVGFDAGGYFLVRHYLARAFLFLSRRGPWDYTAFLDAAAERLLLVKAGGGYAFVHQHLRDYIASAPRSMADSA